MLSWAPQNLHNLSLPPWRWHKKKPLICPFVLSMLNYCRALLSGSPKHLLDRLQKVQNNAAQLIYRSSKFNHITPLLHTLHWFPIEKRIDFKLASVSFKSLNGPAPTYFSDLFHFYTPRQLRYSADTWVAHSLKEFDVSAIQANFGREGCIV